MNRESNSAYYQRRRVDVIVLPASGYKAEVWSAAVFAQQDRHGDVREDIDLSCLFPTGYISVLLCAHPVSRNPLSFSYRIYIDNLTSAQPVNKTVDTYFKRPWVGNLVIVKYTRLAIEAWGTFTHIKRGEGELAVYLLGEYVRPNKTFQPETDCIRFHINPLPLVDPPFLFVSFYFHPFPGFPSFSPLY